MRRYIVSLRGDWNWRESYNDYEDALDRAKGWRACYEGAITIYDTTTGKLEVYGG